MKPKITIDDVARAAGVSRQTVSRAINDKGEISPSTKAHILSVIDELDYRPNRLAQAMITQRSHMVGLIVPDITNPFFPELARGVQDAALANDYSALISNTDELGGLEIKTLEMMVAQGVDAIISFTHRAAEADLRAFADRFRPLVIVNRLIEHENINSIMVDNARGARDAIDHLVALGHHHIGMLTIADFAPTQIRRVQGYQEALRDHGLPQSDSRIVADSATLAGGHRAAQRLLVDDPEVTALFCYNDLMALGAMRAGHDLGLRVPQDISVVGFDDIQLAAMYSPTLTSVSVDKYALGRLAFQRCLELIDQPNRLVETLHLPAVLAVRDSTGPVRVN